VRIGHTAPSHLRGDHALTLNQAIPYLNRRFCHVKRPNAAGSCNKLKLQKGIS
jgi:hypothetical protein